MLLDRFGREKCGQGDHSGPRRCGNPFRNRWCIHLRGGCVGPPQTRDPDGIGAAFVVQRGRIAFPGSSPHSQAPTDDPWGWFLPAGLASAVEDSVPVAADAVRHLVGKGWNTARLIEEICGVIVGVGDRGDDEAHVTLFGPERHVEAARVLVDAVSGGGAGLGPSLTA